MKSVESMSDSSSSERAADALSRSQGLLKTLLAMTQAMERQ